MICSPSKSRHGTAAYSATQQTSTSDLSGLSGLSGSGLSGSGLSGSGFSGLSGLSDLSDLHSLAILNGAGSYSARRIGQAAQAIALLKRNENSKGGRAGRAGVSCRVLMVNSDQLATDYPFLFFSSQVESAMQTTATSETTTAIHEAQMGLPATPTLPCYANQITPSLFLGPGWLLKKPQFFEDLRITHVVSVMSRAVEPPPAITTKNHLMLFAEDSATCDLTSVLRDGVRFILEALAGDKANISTGTRPSARVFVHCEQGVSRSASVVCAYLMQAHRQTLNSTLAYVQSCRPCARPNPGFMQQLALWEESLQLP